MNAFFPKSSIMIVHKEQTGRGVAGDVDVSPAIFVQVSRDHRHAVAFGGAGNTGLFTYIGEGSVAIVMVEGMSAGGQAARSAFHRNTFPVAIDILPWYGSVFEREAKLPAFHYHHAERKSKGLLRYDKH